MATIEIVLFGQRITLHDRINKNARAADPLGINGADLHDVVDFDNSVAARHGEIALVLHRSAAKLDVAERIGTPAFDNGDIGVQRCLDKKLAVPQSQLRFGRVQLREYALFVMNTDADRHQHASQSDRAGAHFFRPCPHWEKFGELQIPRKVPGGRLLRCPYMRTDKFRELSLLKQLRLEKPAAHSWRVGDQREAVDTLFKEPLDTFCRLAGADELTHHEPSAGCNAPHRFIELN